MYVFLRMVQEDRSTDSFVRIGFVMKPILTFMAPGVRDGTYTSCELICVQRIFERHLYKDHTILVQKYEPFTEQ
jgi:hypothetical protein